MNLGETIYKLRTQRKMSQGDLADALDVSRQSVSKWENNSATPDLEKLIKMSQLFGVTLDELVGRSSPAESPAVKAEAPAPGQSITTGDLVSILLLLFGVLIPIIILVTAEMHNSMVLMVLGLFVIPPLVTICAAFCSPKNKMLLIAFLIYDILTGILACIVGNILAPVIIVIYLIPIAVWGGKLEPSPT